MKNQVAEDILFVVVMVGLWTAIFMVGLAPKILISNKRVTFEILL